MGRTLCKFHIGWNSPFDMKKTKRWTSKSQYAAPRDKQREPLITDKNPGTLVCFYEWKTSTS